MIENTHRQGYKQALLYIYQALLNGIVLQHFKVLYGKGVTVVVVAYHFGLNGHIFILPDCLNNGVALGAQGRSRLRNVVLQATQRTGAERAGGVLVGRGGRGGPGVGNATKQTANAPKNASPQTGTGTLGFIVRVGADRSEEHTSELQSRPHLVCRLLLE